mmetsp:Transcript_60803/g.177694  ORF Transcript_60803/g.177694 Transcript_60803/m.177694 type:complete len:155 (-) Transcript_60803:32-496(-)
MAWTGSRAMRITPVAWIPSATSAILSARQSANTTTKSLLLTLDTSDVTTCAPHRDRRQQQCPRCLNDTFGSSSGSTPAASRSGWSRLTGTSCGLLRVCDTEVGDFCLRIRQHMRGGSRSLRCPAAGETSEPADLGPLAKGPLEAGRIGNAGARG